MISVFSRIAWSWPSTKRCSFFCALLRVELGVILDRLREPVIALHRGVARQHVEDEAFLDGLLHGVAVERAVFHRPVRLRLRVPEDLQPLVLRGSGEGEVARVWEELARLHEAVDLIFERLLLVHLAGLGERLRHGRSGSPALARMGLRR